MNPQETQTLVPVAKNALIVPVEDNPIPGLYLGTVTKIVPARSKFDEKDIYCITAKLCRPNDDFEINCFYNKSLKEYSRLRGLAEGILGKRLSKNENSNYDVNELIGKKALFEIVQNDNKYMCIKAAYSLDNPTMLFEQLGNRRPICFNKRIDGSSLCMACPLANTCTISKISF